MKRLFRIFLSLSWLLLGFNSNTKANVVDSSILYSQARSVLHAEYVVPPFKTCDEFPVLWYHTTPPEYKYERLYEERDEQNNSTQTLKKKRSDNSSYFTSFYATSSKFFHYFPDQETPVAHNYSFLSLSRTIVFGVFRI